MSKSYFYPRYIAPRLAEALEDSPVVLIHGPRQCGKTTLAQFACAPNYLKWDDNDLVWGEDRMSGECPNNKGTTSTSPSTTLLYEKVRRPTPLALLPTCRSESFWTRYNVSRSCSQRSSWKSIAGAGRGASS